MAKTVSTDRALDAVDAERDAWEELVTEVGEERLEKPGAMGKERTFKDLAAHMAAWMTYDLDEIDPPESPAQWPKTNDTDKVNAWIYEQSKDRPAGDVLRDAYATYLRLRGFVAELSAKELNDPDRFPSLKGKSLGAALVDGSFFSHWHDEHEADVQKWLKQTS